MKHVPPSNDSASALFGWTAPLGGMLKCMVLASSMAVGLLHGQTTSTINFDTAENWTQGSAAFGSYSNHSYSESSWNFTSAGTIRNTTTAQDGFAGALGTYSWRLQNTTTSHLTATYASSMTVAGFGFDVRRWDSSPDNNFIVEYSTDAGSSFVSTGITINNAYLNNSSDWKTLTYTLPAPVAVTAGQLVVKIYATAAGERIMVDNFQWTTGSAGSDTTPPSIMTRVPDIGAVNVDLSPSFSITFSEAIAAGTGSIQLFKEAGASDVAVPISAVNISGSTATFTANAALENSQTYYVLIDNNAITDTATPTPNAFAGISSETEWTFTTVAPDTTGPVATSFAPQHNATGVDPDANLTVTFDEMLLPGTGNVLIKKVSDNSTVATLDVTNGAVASFFNNELILDPPTSLPVGTALYVEVPAGAATDTLANPTLALGGAANWSFTTRVIPELTASGPYTQNFTGFSVTAPALPDGWTLTGAVTGFNADTSSQVWGFGTGSGLRGPDLLGYQHTSSTGTLVKTLTLLNATGSEITGLTVSYAGRAERLTETRKPAYTVEVAGVLVTGLGYSTNDGDNQIRSAGITGLSIPAGGTFTIKWTSDRDLSNSGSSRQIGLDDVSVSVGVATFAPTVAAVTPDFATLTQNGVDVSSEVTSDGGAALTGRGFVYSPVSANSNPEIGGTAVTQVADASATVGSMSASLSGLLPFTNYVVRSYATNAQGTSYSATAMLITLQDAPSFVTEFSQSFDDFSGSIVTGNLPAGWKVVSSGGVNGFAGTWGPATSAGGLLGNVNSPGVLGYQHVTSSGVATVTLSLKNDTGSTISQLYVSYLGRVERATESRSPEWAVSVNGTAVTELAYSTASGVDETKSHLVTGLSIAPGSTFTITWVSDSNVGSSGARRQIGIEDVYVGLSAPSGGGYADWAGANAGGQTADLDFDTDGMANGVEFFMDAAAGFTANPGVVAGKVSWPNGGNLSTADYGTKFVVQTSANLSGWTDVLVTDPNLSNTAGALEYTLPTGETKIFVRLVVTP